ncbi:hypothetical protein NFI00_000191 [Salmonella enterica]|nr:hypothetical protein [Salmonella enterica]
MNQMITPRNATPATDVALNDIDFNKIAPQSYYQGAEVRTIVDHVVREVEAMVTSTMGPNGRLAVISYGTEPKTTKDGVTVARSIKFTNEAAEYVNRIITEPALKTDEECGDGTTTTIFLTKLLYDLMIKHNTFLKHKRIEEIVQFMINKLKAMAIIPGVDSDELKALALTSSNNDTAIATTIVDTFRNSKTGYPSIELRQGSQSVDVVEPITGLPLRMKFANAAFSRHGNGENTTLENYVAVGVDAMLSIQSDEQQRSYIGALKNLATKYPNQPILLIARSIENDLCGLVMQINKAMNSWIIPVTTGLGGTLATLLLGDILTVLGGKLVTSVTEVDTVDMTVCQDKLVLGSDRALLTDITPETQARVNARIEEVKQSLAELQQADRFSLRARFTESRIRDLKGELIVIYVGGETQSEVKERIDRFEDVNKAVRSALDNGILPGSGFALRGVGVEVKRNFDNDEDVELVNDIFGICYQQYLRLFGSLGLFDTAKYQQLVEQVQIDELDEEFSIYLNLATGERGLPQDIGVFDTAYASITALRGGLKTAKILAQTDTILLGSKLGARQF